MISAIKISLVQRRSISNIFSVLRTPLGYQMPNAAITINIGTESNAKIGHSTCMRYPSLSMMYSTTRYTLRPKIAIDVQYKRYKYCFHGTPHVTLSLARCDWRRR